MSVLVITWNFPPRRGGIENLMGRLCRRIKTNRPVHVITSFHDSSDAQEDWVYRSRWPGLGAFFIYAFVKGFFLLRKDLQIRFVLGGSALATPLVVLLAKIFRRKALVNVHGLDLIHTHIFYQAVCVRCIRYCDRVISNSWYTASLAKRKGARDDSLVVIPPGVDVVSPVCSEADKARENMGLRGKKILLFVGRLARRKGLREFIERCFPRIQAEIPEVCFVIIGENPVGSLIHDDDVFGELRALVHEMCLEDHVRLLGSVNDENLVGMYQAADLFVLPCLSMASDTEGFGIVILEAAMAGKPCVAARVGGIPDAVEDGKTGILTEPGDYEMMRRAVVDLLRNDGRRFAMGANAHERAREKFDSAKIAQKYEEVFLSLQQ